MKSGDPLRYELADGTDTRPAKQPHLWRHFTSLKLLKVPDWSVLQHRDFRLLWAAGGVSTACRWMEVAVLGWLILELTNSPWEVALVGVCRSAPMLAFGLFSGLIADRMNRWSILLLAQTGSALVTFALLALLLLQRTQPWQVFLGTFILGCGTILDLPSRRSLIYDLVGPQHLVSAMSLETVNNTVGKFLGPLMGGVAIALSGFQGVYLLLLLAYLSTIGLIVQMRAAIGRPLTRAQPVWQSLASGVHYALHQRILLGVLGTTFIMNAMAFSYVQLLPVVARDHLRVGPGWMGLLASADGLGTLIGVLLIAALGSIEQPGRIFLLGSCLELVSLVAFALSPWYGLSCALLLVVGVGNAGFSTMQSTLILLAVAPSMRGRALGIMGLCIGATPLGLLELGALAEIVQAPAAIGFNAGAALVFLLLIIALTPLLSGPMASPTDESGVVAQS
jgi:predicted MFS family arabinose efflux permease